MKLTITHCGDVGEIGYKKSFNQASIEDAVHEIKSRFDACKDVEHLRISEVGFECVTLDGFDEYRIYFDNNEGKRCRHTFRVEMDEGSGYEQLALALREAGLTF